jgi:hypothetical protein
MQDLKDYLVDRLTFFLVGLNVIFQYFNIEHLKSTILWVFTIILLIFRIRAQYLKNLDDKEQRKVELEIKMEQLKFTKQENLIKENENFYKKFNQDFNKE